MNLVFVTSKIDYEAATDRLTILKYFGPLTFD